MIMWLTLYECWAYSRNQFIFIGVLLIYGGFWEVHISEPSSSALKWTDTPLSLSPSLVILWLVE